MRLLKFLRGTVIVVGMAILTFAILLHLTGVSGSHSLPHTPYKRTMQPPTRVKLGHESSTKWDDLKAWIQATNPSRRHQ